MIGMKPLAVAIALTGTGVVVPAISQESAPASEDGMEEVVVTGLRSSLEHSIDIRRNSTQFVEAVTAEDIGKMPDQNIAETLQRLPGVQIDRRDGEGTKVRIRGLDQNVTLLNGERFTSGMEYFQMNEWKQEYDGSLEGVPSELLGGVEVYKTPVASMVEGGMGGVVNLKTRSAFALDAPLVAANIKGDYGQDSGDAQPSGFLVLGNNWNDKFAAIVTLSTTNKTQHTDFIQNFSRENSGILTTNGGAVQDTFDSMAAERDVSVEELGSSMTFDEFLQTVRDAGGTPYMAPGMYYVMDTEQERERIGGSVTLQWRPTDSMEVGFDWFRNELEVVNHQYTVKHPMATDGFAGFDESQPFSLDTSGKVGVVESAVFNADGAGMETNTAGEVSESTADNFALRVSFDDGGPWRASGSINYAAADQKQRAGYMDSRMTPYNVTSWVGTDASPSGWAHTPNNVGPDGGSYGYSYSAGDRPDLAMRNADWLQNPAYRNYKSAWALGSDVEYDNWSARADVEYDIALGDLRTLKFGLRMAGEDVEFNELRYLTDFSRTQGAASPAQFDEDGNLIADSTFDPDADPGEGNPGIQEAVYYDLCGNGGIPANQSCDIDGDGIDDNQPFGPWGYFHDSAIGSKAGELTTSSGIPFSQALYGADFDRWSSSPGVIPWQNFTMNPGAYTSVGDFFPSGGYLGRVIMPDAGVITDDVSAWHDGLAPNAPSRLFLVPLESWAAAQTTSAFYVEADFVGEALPYNLNVGLRAVKTDVEITSVVTTPQASLQSLATDGWNSQGVLLDGTFTTETTEETYWDLLPSVNFALDTSEDTKLRFSAAKVIARPNLQDMGKGFSKNYTRVDAAGGGDYFQFTGGSAGNPLLEPFRATQADIAYDWYFGELGYVSVGAFMKAVDTFIATETRTETQPDFSPDEVGTGGVSRPVNGDGGSVKGLEFALQQSFDNGFGYSFNYTFSDSKTSVTSMTHDDLGLPGVSENAFNLMGFFENEFLSARLAYTWRDEYLSPYRSNFGLVNHVVNTVETPAMAEFFDAYGQWDANVTWHAMDNLSFTAEAINLTGEEQTSYLEFSDNPMTYSMSEPRVALGVNYRL
ncbi:TonB-dependent receptor domain-containing protein [Microbulbifer rhizosphaerae]|uniref:Outer membrane receptor protein involved in Fe transport n=1 Tax=Microbulbifer rhizosphaerae TaxID=1562603 RepID=A0A7W4WCL6_9GAMM|nr:TonB-dependent receptor [Microbulbifer rhizosphaerae]MBB3061786.1 outer membrane receptor protein involved in Fe transport [Microbulbifer rhizosphaerae]